MYELPEKYNTIVNKFGNPIESVNVVGETTKNYEIKISNAWFAKNMSLYYPNIKGRAVPQRMYVNNAILKLLEDTLHYFKLEHPNFLQELGCYAPRMKRSRPEPSVHTWGLAIDINWTSNPMGSPRKPNGEALTDEMIAKLKSLGWECGALWTRPDYMHNQLPGLGI